MRANGAPVLFVALLAAARPGRAQGPPPVDPEELIRLVVASQRRAEISNAESTFDQREVQTAFDSKGRVKETLDRLWWVSSEAGGERLRQLVLVNGRPATDAEKREAAEKDAKERRERAEARAARAAQDPPRAGGPEDDPRLGARRLSELLSRYDFEMLDEALEEDRPVYRLRFRPRAGVPARTLSERALSSLAGTVTIDASDLQVRSVDARLVRPVKVAGGIAASVKTGGVVYEASQTAPGRWAPCRVELRVTGRTAIFVRLDSSFRSEFANFRRFEVDVSSTAGGARSGSAP